MDARAYLQRQGWRGSGHSLDKHDRGIKKPLLISHKQDTMGLGKKKAAHTTDDQWWMRAFDESLKNIGTGQEVLTLCIIPARAKY
jgi:nucleolar protein TMA23